MATTWTLTAGEICTDALQHIGVIGAEEAPSAADFSRALRALDAVLSELPLSGYNWPKLSGEVALTWDAAAPSGIAVPADYYGYPFVWRLVDGKRIPLQEIPHAEWVKTVRGDETGAPTHFYLSPAKVITFYPIPQEDPAAYLQYQRLVDDAVSTTAPDLPSFWVNALGYGVANEISLMFGVEQAKRIEIAQRWDAKKNLCLQSSVSLAPISFTVDD